jgi:hypothetical protein
MYLVKFQKHDRFMSVVNNPERVVAVLALTTTRRGQKNDHNAKNDQISIFVRSAPSATRCGCFFSLTERFRCLGVTYRYTSCTRQSIVEREGLKHDERSEEERVRQHVL